MLKKVSVIIPLYNGEVFIRETLESCKAQDYQNLEVILVDDCSTDNGFTIARSLIDCYGDQSKFRYIQNSCNSGILLSCNHGAQIATGECLLFLGHDDILPPEYISTIMMKYDETLAFVFSEPDLINDKGVIFKTHQENYKEETFDLHQIKFGLTKENMISSTGLIINAAKFAKVGGFDTKYRNYGEWNLWIRLLQQGDAKYCAAVHALYRRHSTNITNTFSQKQKRKELVAYWNGCRRLAMRTFDLSINERIEANWYYVRINLLEHKRITKSIRLVKSCIRKIIRH